jgi:hypothetical protein
MTPTLVSQFEWSINTFNYMHLSVKEMRILIFETVNLSRLARLKYVVAAENNLLNNLLKSQRFRMYKVNNQNGYNSYQQNSNSSNRFVIHIIILLFLWAARIW